MRHEWTTSPLLPALKVRLLQTAAKEDTRTLAGTTPVVSALSRHAVPPAANVLRFTSHLRIDTPQYPIYRVGRKKATEAGWTLGRNAEVTWN